MNQYDLTGEYGIGYTSNTNEPFYFDLEDYELIKNYTWSARHDKRRKKENYYIESFYTTDIPRPNSTKYKQKRIHLHHLVMGYDDSKIQEIPLIDHKNQITYDCRKENLHVADLRINNINKPLQSSNTSGIIGVNYNKVNNVWVARICDKLNHRLIVCQVRDKEKAIIARLQAEKEYYGDNAPQKHLFKEYGIE